MTVAWNPGPTYVGKHRGPKRPRPVAPLAPAVPLDEIALECEGLFVVLRHLGDGRTEADSWALGKMDTLDIITAQACAA